MSSVYFEKSTETEGPSLLTQVLQDLLAALGVGCASPPADACAASRRPRWHLHRRLPSRLHTPRVAAGPSTQHGFLKPLLLVFAVGIGTQTSAGAASEEIYLEAHLQGFVARDFSFFIRAAYAMVSQE